MDICGRTQESFECSCSILTKGNTVKDLKRGSGGRYLLMGKSVCKIGDHG